MAALSTRAVFLTDTALYSYASARVLSVGTSVGAPLGAPCAVVLDATVAHAQGGGQPGDRGVIVFGDGSAAVFATARWGVGADGGAIFHYGWLLDAEAAGRAAADPAAAADAVVGDSAPPGALADATTTELGAGAGATASVYISRPWRVQCAALHSAGHLLDGAVRRVVPALAAALLPAGETPPNLVGGKGNHFPTGPPSVEYTGSLPPPLLAAFQEAVNAQIQALIAEGERTRVILLSSRDELPRALSESAANPAAIDGMDAGALATIDVQSFPADKQLRIVAVGGADNVCPCGGTHVKRVGALTGLRVIKVTSKKGVTKLSYEIKP